MSKVIIDKIQLEDLINIVRKNYIVEFSENYINRVKKSRSLIEHFDKEKVLVYGVTTGVGDNYTKYVEPNERSIAQHNFIRSHATSVGEPLNIECVRAIMTVMLTQFGSGHTGMSLETITAIKDLLNSGVTPYVPKNGSVGYLCLEGHIGLVLIGEGKAYYKGELLSGLEALTKANLKPITLKTKEGLTMLSGTTSVTALGALSIYDMKNILLTADIAGAMSLEVLKGQLMAFDEKIMKVRPHIDQSNTATNVRNILEGSEIVKKYEGHRLQDALSLRCIPQLHGATKVNIKNAINIINIELNSSCDNPQLFEENQKPVAISACNADSSYVGIALDSASISLTSLCKMSERRIDRMVNGNISELPAFLSNNCGVNSGLMIPQYSAVGMLSQMKILSHPSTIDGMTTCANQEDYTANGYNAVLKAYEMTNLARYIFAIEIVSSCQAYGFYKNLKKSTAIENVYSKVREQVPFIEEDLAMSDYFEYVNILIKNSTIIEEVEKSIGKLKF